MTLLLVQQISQPAASTGSSGGAATWLEVVVIFVLVATTLVIARDWRQLHAGDGATLASEAERWLRDQLPGQ